jgi:hypothetical protein
MHARRIICFVLGLWLGGAALMIWVEREIPHSADRLFSAPWSGVQLVLGAGLFLFVLFGSREGKLSLLLLLLMLAVVAAQAFALGPELALLDSLAEALKLALASPSPSD